MISIELASLKADKEEKQARLKRNKEDRDKSSFESRLTEITLQTSRLEEERDALSSELQYISTHSESRAKLDLKQDELRRKKQELTAT